MGSPKWFFMCQLSAVLLLIGLVLCIQGMWVTALFGFLFLLAGVAVGKHAYEIDRDG